MNWLTKLSKQWQRDDWIKMLEQAFLYKEHDSNNPDDPRYLFKQFELGEDNDLVN